MPIYNFSVQADSPEEAVSKIVNRGNCYMYVLDEDVDYVNVANPDTRRGRNVAEEDSLVEDHLAEVLYKELEYDAAEDRRFYEELHCEPENERWYPERFDDSTWRDDGGH